MSIIEANVSPAADQLPSGLLENIVERLDPRRVVLFGSHATGRAHRDSDWDLLIIVDDDVPAEHIDWRRMHELRRGIDAASDLIPYRESAFRERVDVVGSLPWTVAGEGVVIYERANRA
jgi:predicted nucleotidyltransferase